MMGQLTVVFFMIYIFLILMIDSGEMTLDGKIVTCYTRCVSLVISSSPRLY